MRLPLIPWSIAGVPSSQVLPGFLITAPASVCVPAVIGALAVWIQNHQKKKPNSYFLPERETQTAAEPEPLVLVVFQWLVASRSN